MKLPTGEITCTTPERVIFGKPASEVLVTEAERRDCCRVCLIVSDQLRRSTDQIERIEKCLGKRFAGTYSGIPAHTPRSAVLAATRFVQDAGADLLVAIGGGTVIDLTKMVPICLANDVQSLEDFDRIRMYARPAGGFDYPPVTAPNLRIINIPTTLAGAEFTSIAGVTEESTREKHGYIHPLMAAVTVILDPALTIGTPEQLWLSTGVRGIDHAAETLASLLSNPVCDGMAATGLRLLRNGLLKSLNDFGNLTARLECQMGAWQAIVPLNAGVPMGLSHAIGHVLGGTCNVPHGYTSCVMLPYVMDWNIDINQERQALISRCFDAPDQSAALLLDGFIRELGMPRTLREVGVDENDLQKIARHTISDPFGRTNPRPVETVDDILPVLQAALG